MSTRSCHSVKSLVCQTDYVLQQLNALEVLHKFGIQIPTILWRRSLGYFIILPKRWVGLIATMATRPTPVINAHFLTFNACPILGQVLPFFQTRSPTGEIVVRRHWCLLAQIMTINNVIPQPEIVLRDMGGTVFSICFNAPYQVPAMRKWQTVAILYAVKVAGGTRIGRPGQDMMEVSILPKTDRLYLKPTYMESSLMYHSKLFLILERKWRDKAFMAIQMHDAVTVVITLLERIGALHARFDGTAAK